MTALVDPSVDWLLGVVIFTKMTTILVNESRVSRSVGARGILQRPLVAAIASMHSIVGSAQPPSCSFLRTSWFTVASSEEEGFFVAAIATRSSDEASAKALSRHVARAFARAGGSALRALVERDVDAVEAKMEAYTVQDEIDALELDVAEEKRERSWREGRVSVSRETETMEVFTSFAEQHLRPMLAK